MTDIVISEFMDPAAVETLSDGFEVRYDPELVDHPAELHALLGDCRALIVRNRTRVDAALLANATRLTVVGRLGVGLDNIDLDTCAARDIDVIPATGANTLAVAEYVTAGLLLLTRGAFLASARVANGEWPRQQLIGGELSGRTLGLVGFGAIAREVATRAHALGMTTAAHDPLLAVDDPAWRDTQRCADLHELLSVSDAVSLHVPLTPQTRHLIDTEALATMKPGAVLINTARGGVVDEAALAEALRDGRLAGAALDVFEQEPLSAGSVLDGVPNLILTPHIAGVTREANRRVSTLIACKIREALA
jgi:(S)-sulfolactate dehydrogenase